MSGGSDRIGADAIEVMLSRSILKMLRVIDKRSLILLLIFFRLL